MAGQDKPLDLDEVLKGNTEVATAALATSYHRPHDFSWTQPRPSSAVLRQRLPPPHEA